MNKTGAYLAVKALEQIGVQFTFGIPGVHTTEIYDELNKSKQITPILVTHELGGGFAADAVSRTSDSIGTLVIVPGAGITHAMSAIGEAYLDGIPLLIISGGIRTDSGNSYQLHDVDQLKILDGITKKAYRVTDNSDVVDTIYNAFDIATSGKPGPVFVELPANLLLFPSKVDTIQPYQRKLANPPIDNGAIEQAVSLIKRSEKVGLYLGWGSKEASELSLQLAELLEAPVSTTLQGLSVFPANHPLHTGMGFGGASVPVAENAFKDCDCLIAVGTCFSEIPTGSFSMPVPKNLIHIDIDDVFNKNYEATVAIKADAKDALKELLIAIIKENINRPVDQKLREQIKTDKGNYTREWLAHDSKDRVNPMSFFQGLRNALPDDSYLVADDGNHTFLCEELFPVNHVNGFISPTDFNAMGYAAPAAIGVKLANPDKPVVAVIGDGCFLMTGLETITATNEKLGIVYCIFSDGELSQISQGQLAALDRKTCTVLGNIKLEGIALATGAEYLALDNNEDVDAVLAKAMSIAEQNKPVIVDVNIDYSKQTRFTKGVVKATLNGFALKDKARFIGRVVKRKIFG